MEFQLKTFEINSICFHVVYFSFSKSGIRNAREPYHLPHVPRHNKTLICFGSFQLFFHLKHTQEDIFNREQYKEVMSFSYYNNHRLNREYL